MLTITRLLLATFVALAATSFVVVAEGEPTDADKALLEAYRSGRQLVHSEYWAIHAKPVAGQCATFRDAAGVERTYRVAYVRDNVCTVERQLPGSQVVEAVEFELSGQIENIVLRAWVGLKGQKAIPAKTRPIVRRNPAVGLGGGVETEIEPFTEFEQGGKLWNGVLTTTRYWHSRQRDGKPDRLRRVWKTDENWFEHALRIEVEEPEKEMLVEALIAGADESEPLLDWSEVAAPTPEQVSEIRTAVLRSAAEGDLERMVRGDFSKGHHWGLHPQAKVGDWAEYGTKRLTLVKLENGLGIVECMDTDDELGLVEAMEFRVEDGEAVRVIERFAGIRGEQPLTARISTYRDARPLQIKEGDWHEVEFAGREWTARLVTEIRTSPRPNLEKPYEQITERLVSDVAPFGQPLRVRRYWGATPDDARVVELTALGTDAKPALDWSPWQRSQDWAAPFKAEDVKRFIKVGMKWRYSQVFDKGEEGLVTTYQDWEVTEVSAEGYRVQCVLEQPDEFQHTLEASYTWDDYILRFDTWPQGTTEKRTMKFGDREIEVTLYRFQVSGKDVLFGLSADLPGVRICTEETLVWPSKVWLVEFHESDE